MKPKLVVILGPTASGKSSLAIKLARKFRGEIISADSRQVYKDMDIGTGKVTKSEQEMVPHHLLDVASPKRQFTVSQFKSLAQKAIKDTSERGHLPILVGGTAFYIYSLIDDLELPSVKPDKKLRKELEKRSAAELFVMLKKMDPARARSIDKNNPRRLIRAIEIIKTTGDPIPPRIKKSPAFDSLILGMRTEQKKLYNAIDSRLDARLKQGLVAEVKKLLKHGVSHKKLQSFGLEYKYASLYLQGKLDYEHMVKELKNAIRHFSKRQTTWFKKDDRIHWITTLAEAQKLTRKFTK
jgi:tRNA dimethylallyltransferase